MSVMDLPPVIVTEDPVRTAVWTLFRVVMSFTCEYGHSSMYVWRPGIVLLLCMLQVIHPLLDVTFSEESSDEEYNPAADVSDESEGEESDEELGDTSLCDAEVPPIGERQDGLKSTGMYNACTYLCYSM